MYTPAKIFYSSCEQKPGTAVFRAVNLSLQISNSAEDDRISTPSPLTEIKITISSDFWKKKSYSISQNVFHSCSVFKES